MKTIKKTLIFAVMMAWAAVSIAQNEHADHNYWQLSARVGYDSPTVNNNTPYIDYNGGLDLGLSADYYWSWFGLGFDFDYIKNSPENTYPMTNLFDSGGVALTDLSLTEEGLNRSFYGIGPNFKYTSVSGKFHAELNTRIGLGSIKNGRVELRENSVLNDRLNFHAGYDANVLSTKAQVRFTYFFNPTFGIHAGAYYLRHFNVSEALEGGVAASYRELVSSNTTAGNMLTGDVLTRSEACEHDISSIGVFAGLTIKLKPKHTTSCCNTCSKYSLGVTARDAFTRQVLANTDIALKDVAGAVVQTATTNSFGIVVFDDIEKDNYTIDAKLYNIALTTSVAGKNEFIAGETLQKEVLYEDESFILEGNAVVCNTATGLPGVDVILKNLSVAQQKSTMTDAQGKYILHISQTGVYELRGKKNNYFSQTVTVNPLEYDRNTTLFVKLEICLEEANCGTAIALQNILYDLDKFFIRDDAKPELNRLVVFMKDNPGVKIEVSSHTDARGSNPYNQTLSQNRASAAVDYVVSQGVSRARIFGIGYGETRLLNACADGANCSEAQHQMNRRTEMKVICN